MTTLETLDDLIELAKIEFPEPVGQDELRKLFTYLSNKTRCDISWYFEINERTSVRFGDPRAVAESHSVSTSVNASIFAGESYLERGANLESLRGYRDPSVEDNNLISGMQFQITPGWGVSDYRNGVLGLFSDFKTETANYFAERERDKHNNS